MVNAVNKVLRDCIPDITMLFLGDILIKGCLEDMKDETVREDRSQRLVADHISNCEKISDSWSTTYLLWGEVSFQIVEDLGGLVPMRALLGVGKAACAEEIIQQSV